MPTGYTAKLYEGTDQSFEEFVWGCARAFGALILMRDDATDAPIPEEFTPDTEHYERKLAEARDQLTAVQAWSPREAGFAADADYAKQMDAWTESQDRRQATLDRYDAMLREVEAWQPPTADHAELKSFMVDQLTKSIEFDCTTLPEPTRQTGVEFKEARLSSLTWSIEYDESHIVAEVNRTRGRNDWVRALRESLSVSA